MKKGAQGSFCEEGPARPAVPALPQTSKVPHVPHVPGAPSAKRSRKNAPTSSAATSSAATSGTGMDTETANPDVADTKPSISDQLEAILETMATKNDMTSLESKIDDLESKMATKDDTASLESKIDDLESKMTNLESKMTNLESKMTNLENKIFPVAKLSKVKTSVPEPHPITDDIKAGGQHGGHYVFEENKTVFNAVKEKVEIARQAKKPVPHFVLGGDAGASKTTTGRLLAIGAAAAGGVAIVVDTHTLGVQLYKKSDDDGGDGVYWWDVVVPDTHVLDKTVQSLVAWLSALDSAGVKMLVLNDIDSKVNDVNQYQRMARFASLCLVITASGGALLKPSSVKRFPSTFAYTLANVTEVEFGAFIEATADIKTMYNDWFDGHEGCVEEIDAIEADIAARGSTVKARFEPGKAALLAHALFDRIGPNLHYLCHLDKVESLVNLPHGLDPSFAPEHIISLLSSDQQSAIAFDTLHCLLRYEYDENTTNTWRGPFEPLVGLVKACKGRHMVASMGILEAATKKMSLEQLYMMARIADGLGDRATLGKVFERICILEVLGHSIKDHFVSDTLDGPNRKLGDTEGLESDGLGGDSLDALLDFRVLPDVVKVGTMCSEIKLAHLTPGQFFLPTSPVHSCSDAYIFVGARRGGTWVATEEEGSGKTLWFLSLQYTIAGTHTYSFRGMDAFIGQLKKILPSQKIRIAHIAIVPPCIKFTLPFTHTPSETKKSLTDRSKLHKEVTTFSVKTSVTCAGLR